MKMSGGMGKFKTSLRGLFSMRTILIIGFIFFCRLAVANSILIPMDETQSNHLKAYGIAYWILKNDIEVDWLLRMSW